MASNSKTLPLVGVFSLDSPTRPNPIGLSLVRLLRIEQGRNLVVTGLDYFDGTPIVDIKPYEKKLTLQMSTRYQIGTRNWKKKQGMFDLSKGRDMIYWFETFSFCKSLLRIKGSAR